MPRPSLLSIPWVAWSVALLGLPSRAQSINVDFGPASSPAGSPPSTYGAAAQSPGTWNPVGVRSATNLLTLSGAPTAVSLSTATLPQYCFFQYSNIPSNQGADEPLLDDYYDPTDCFGDWTFDGLASGEYEVDTIIVTPAFQVQSIDVTVEGSPDGVQSVAGIWSGAYTQGQNYTRHHKTVADGRIHITFAAQKLHDCVVLNGIQLVKEDPIGTPRCFGDGSATPCPCGNNGQTGQGCENSASTGGALLQAFGTTTPDTVLLWSSGELSSALTIFLQGNAVIPPASFGDGLRCAGGILKRLYVKNASGASVSAPGAGDPSITARSAALGDPIAPGERRYYQTYYRDASASWCAPPLGGTFNASNSVKIVW
jgi:hypothetical protein